MNREEAVRFAAQMAERAGSMEEQSFYLLAEEALREMIRGEWIPVAVRLPRDSRPVLAATDRGAVFRAYYDHVHKCWRTTKSIRITHWRRMPLPPERDE